MKLKTLFACLCLLINLSLLAENGIHAPRKVIIGGDFNYPPYEYLNAQGKPDGYNVELSRAICRILNWKPEFRLAKWALVRQWLDSGEIDLIQGMAFSVERAQIMRLSDSHTQTWRSIFVHKGSRIKGTKDLMDANVVLQQGDIAAEYLKWINFQGLIIEVPTQEDALKFLDAGDYDAAIVNHMNGMHYLKQDKLEHIKALPHRIQQKEYSYAAKDQLLIDQINNALLIMAKSGQLQQIQEKWFGKLDYQPYDTQTWLKVVLMVALPLLVILISVGVWLTLLRRKYRILSSNLVNESQIRQSIETELARENHIFIRGPVIIYKMQVPPPKLLMISENIDQWGYGVDEILEWGEGYSEIVFSEDRNKYLDQFQTREPVEYKVQRYRILTKSGEIRWVLDYATSVESITQKQYYYGYMMDITSQKNLEAQLMESKEKAEAASMAKTYFLANMSHEIRTPLNGIMGFIQVLMQLDATPEQKEYYEIMYSAGKSLMKIINDILDFSKIESGKLDLIISDFSPRHLIEDIIKPFVYQNKKPNLAIRVHVNERVPNVLHGDQLRLKQIFVNLLQNGVKFTDSGYVEISADVYTQGENDVRLLFSVSDTGIGIDPRKQQDIFDNFSQADPFITSKYGGTGLGLSIVKRLVELMSGFIWVESEQGKGSSFYFILPFAQKSSESAPAEKHALPTETRLPLLKGMKVLLAEDEPINQVVTRRQLEGWAILVDIAADGQEALDKCRKQNYDAILMDIQMPVMDGITATQTIRLREFTTGMHTPIIAFTAAALVGDRERFIDSGMDDYIAKPIDMAMLHAILKKYYKPNIGKDKQT